MTDQPGSNERKALLKNALLRINELQARLDAVENAHREPIAIIGIGCRFPGGANDPDAFWNLLHDGVDAVRPIPPERWDTRIFDDLGLEKQIAWQCGLVDNIDQFDPQFFNISPREANTMDPQQRMVLEVSWQALENAGVTGEQLTGSLTGVFMGVSISDYAQILRAQNPTEVDIYAATGGAINAISGRVAYALGLNGPTVSVDTACSSSLVAIHLACLSLRSGETTMALAGGVNAVLNPEPYLSFARWGMMAPDGRCKTFDERADGFVRGEGCGVLVLKRLSDAQANGDRILAIIRGSAVNNDGRSSGLTVPSGRAQAAVVRAALKDAGVKPGQVSYVETHGTGTAIGDPIEVEALGSVLGEGRPADFPLVLGSVKTNIGHLESASGVAGLIKVVLSMQNGEIPPILHLQQRSSRIPWPQFPVEVPVEPRPWPAGDQPRLAGVSSFGFTGTNAHVILEESPHQAETASSASSAEAPAHLLVLSGKTARALTDQAEQYARYLSRETDTPINRICRTAALNRTAMHYRLAVAGTREEMQAALSAYAAGETPKGVFNGQAERGGPGKIAFLFTGQGSQWAGMGKQLYEQQPVFREALDRCAKLLRSYLPEPLLSVIFPEDDNAPLLNHTTYTQPALFALEYSLAMLWQSWGIKPHAVLGHSVGEYAAACAAGVFSLEDGIKLIATRARLMGSLPAGGQMAAILASEAKVSQVLAQLNLPVSIAAINGPESVVISGAGNAVESVIQRLQQEGIQTRAMNVSHAFHSHLMDSILDSFEQTAGTIAYRQPGITVISNVTGKPETDLLTSPGYWRQHIRQPVRFYEGIQSLYDQGCRLFIEIGPHPVLIGMGQQCLPESAEPVKWLPSLRRSRPDLLQILESLGAAWVSGMAVNWQTLYQDTPATPVKLPTYPFQRQRYWVDVANQPASRRQMPQNQIHPLLGKRLSSPLLNDLVYETQLWLDQPAFLNDHRLYGAPIFPGSAYLEIGQAAARQVYPNQPVRLENISLTHMLTLSEDDEQIIQVAASPALPDRPAKFQVFSLNNDGSDTWALNAAGNILPGSPNLSIPEDSLQAARARCQKEYSAEEYYRLFDSIWFAYGPSFKGLRKVWCKEYEAVGEIALPDSVAAEAHHFILHPGLMDACIQLFGAAIPNMEEELKKGTFYAPVNIKSYQIQVSGITRLIGRTRIEPLADNPDTMIATIWLYDESETLVGTVEEMVLRKSKREMITKALGIAASAANLYVLNWEKSQQPVKAFAPLTGQWLVTGSEDGVGKEAAALINRQGGKSQFVSVVELSEAINRANGANDALRGVIYCAGLASGDVPSTSELQTEQQTILGGLFQVAQTLLDAQPGGNIPSLVVVTCGAQAVQPGEPVPALAQATLWGTARALMAEHPELKCVALDLDPQAETAVSAWQLYTALQVIGSGVGENQLAFRAGQLYGVRLVRMNTSLASPSAVEVQPSPLQNGTPYKLFIKERGMLENLELHPTGHAALHPHQVEIAVKAAGLNFRDVLNVLGMLPETTDDLGHECAGVISAVGDAVTRFKVGDEVFGIATGSFASHVTTHEDLVIHKPQTMSFTDAATIPITFLTTYYALIRLARMQKGERVLIHSAAGGVGMAAVQLAQQVGAEIFATAGSEEKRSLLRSLGIRHVMDSRTLEFADQIMEWTHGEGVDIVLNALSGDFLQRSFEVLKPGGRFLEIGMRGILTPEQVAALGKNHEYHIIFLGDLCVNHSALIQEMLLSLREDFSSGALQPLNSTVFPIEKASDAFRFMAQAKHIGKVVLTLPEDGKNQPTPAGIRSDASYLITGGLGGIGLETAQWLATRGAKSLVLVSRRQPTEDAQKVLDEIRASGAQVTVLNGDVACEEDVLQILNTIRANLPPLRGIIHSAGVLGDTSFMQLDWPQIDHVLAPKVYGAWNLHRHTLDLPLDFFVLYSAGAAVFGSTGQANYASANAFLDALAHFRRAKGLPALSINWGPWSDVGMAARSSATLQHHWKRQGVTLMTPDENFQALAQVMDAGVPQAVVITIDWPVFLSQYPSEHVPPFLSAVVGKQPAASHRAPETSQPAVNMLDQLLSTAPEQRRALLDKQIKILIGQVTGVNDPEQIQPSYSLVELGIDSLMIVELRNRISHAYHVDVPLSSLFKFPSLSGLSDHLAAVVLKADVAAAVDISITGEREEIDL